MNAAELKLAIKTEDQLSRDITALIAQLEQAKQELQLLDDTGDLNDPAVLDKISRLHLLMDLLPRRLVIRQDQHAVVKTAMEAGCRRFASQEFKQQLEAALAKAREKARAKLTPLYKGDLYGHLESAIDASSVVASLLTVNGKKKDVLIKLEYTDCFYAPGVAETLLELASEIAKIETTI